MNQQRQQQSGELRRIPGCLGDRWMSWLSTLLALLFLTAGCSRRDAILQEELRSLEEDLKGVEKRIAHADEQLAQARAALSSRDTVMVVSDRLEGDGFYFVTAEDLEFSFHSGLRAVARSWRRPLESQGVTLMIKDEPLLVPAWVRRPYHKPIAFTGRGGVQVILEAHADWDGEWSFPSSDLVSDRIAAAVREGTPRPTSPEMTATTTALFMPTNSRPADRTRGRTSAATAATNASRPKRSPRFRSGQRSEWHLPDEAPARSAESDPSRIPRAVPLQLPSRHRMRLVADPNFTLAPRR